MPSLGSYIGAVIFVILFMFFGIWVFIRAHRNMKATCCCIEGQQGPAQPRGRALLCCYLSLIGTCMLGSVLLLYLFLLGPILRIDWMACDNSIVVLIMAFWMAYTGLGFSFILTACDLRQKGKKKPSELSSDENVVQE
jgi:hypothetical protein